LIKEVRLQLIFFLLPHPWNIYKNSVPLGRTFTRSQKS
jgi:hypothetical protein